MKNNWLALVAIILALLALGLVGNMDYKMLSQEDEWQDSIQAIELQQEKAQADIIRLQEQCSDLEDMTLHQGIRLYEFYQRMNFEFIDSLESEE